MKGEFPNLRLSRKLTPSLGHRSCWFCTHGGIAFILVFRQIKCLFYVFGNGLLGFNKRLLRHEPPSKKHLLLSRLRQGPKERVLCKISAYISQTTAWKFGRCAEAPRTLQLPVNYSFSVQHQPWRFNVTWYWLYAVNCSDNCANGFTEMP